ncbi:4'-phosphopantetheinyl transferase superfamily protein [Orbus wheelerorum]|uniref:4'-phosphopantetheinyl transferase family protein n=1 Tax=Orbus wheelerorum TaxID=3074111 RepID=UPI00370D8BEE
MNYIYTTCLNQLSWSQLKDYQGILTLNDQQTINQLRVNDDKCRTLLGKLLLLYVLKKHATYPALQLPNLTYNQYFKPFIENMQGSFNIAHAGDWVVCAYNEQGQIGVDIEAQQPINIDEYHEVLTEDEIEAINHGKLDFIQLWTLKEAIIKADGRGFYLAPNSFTLPLPFINNSVITVDKNAWFLNWQQVAKNYSLAVASSSKTEGLITKTLTINELTNFFYR